MRLGTYNPADAAAELADDIAGVIVTTGVAALLFTWALGAAFLAWLCEDRG